MATDSLRTFDVIVLGSGPGGYVCAIRLAQYGLKTACIDKGPLGGVCLNVGCIPSKALIHASKVYKKAKDGAVMGVIAGDMHVDMTAMQAWKTGITQKLSGGIGGLFKGNGVTHIAGTGKLAGPGKIVVTGADGKTETVAYGKLVLATGSSPIAIPGFAFDGSQIIDSTGALALSTLPKAMAVIGGGVIGLELTDVYARLGVQVTVIEAADRILSMFDADVARPVYQKQIKLGVKHLQGAKALGAVKLPNGRVRVDVEVAGKPDAVEVDVVLVAVGRRPNTANLGLETVGLAPDKRGVIAVDNQLKTSSANIWAIGDITPGPMLAHKASKDGEVAAESVAGKKTALDVIAIPNVVYTDPEIATVGPTLAELQATGKPLKIGKFAFGALGRAMTANAGDGFVRIVSDQKTDTILAVQIVGAEASELIASAGLALEMGATTEDIALTVHAHPTMAEALMEAAHGAMGHPLHALKP
jgi:dihydrolipoamide dehydrogenase